MIFCLIAASEVWAITDCAVATATTHANIISGFMFPPEVLLEWLNCLPAAFLNSSDMDCSNNSIH